MENFELFNFSILSKLSFSFIFTKSSNELLLKLLDNSPILKTIKIHAMTVPEIIIDDLVLAIDEKFNHRQINILIKQDYNRVKCSWNVFKTLRRGVKIEMRSGIIDCPSNEQILF